MARRRCSSAAFAIAFGPGELLEEPPPGRLDAAPFVAVVQRRGVSQPIAKLPLQPLRQGPDHPQPQRVVAHADGRPVVAGHVVRVGGDGPLGQVPAGLAQARSLIVRQARVVAGPEVNPGGSPERGVIGGRAGDGGVGQRVAPRRTRRGRRGVVAARRCVPARPARARTPSRSTARGLLAPPTPASTRSETPSSTDRRFTAGVYRLCSRRPRGGDRGRPSETS